MVWDVSLTALSLFRLLSSLLRSWRPVATVSFPSPPPLKMNGGPSGFCRDLWSILKKSSQFVGFFPFYFGFFWWKIQFFWMSFLADNAPVTRTIVIASTMLTIAFGFRSRPLRLGLDYQVLFFCLRFPWWLFLVLSLVSVCFYHLDFCQIDAWCFNLFFFS